MSRESIERAQQLQKEFADLQTSYVQHCREHQRGNDKLHQSLREVSSELCILYCRVFASHWETISADLRPGYLHPHARVCQQLSPHDSRGSASVVAVASIPKGSIVLCSFGCVVSQDCGAAIQKYEKGTASCCDCGAGCFMLSDKQTCPVAWLNHRCNTANTKASVAEINLFQYEQDGSNENCDAGDESGEGCDAVEQGNASNDAEDEQAEHTRAVRLMWRDVLPRCHSFMVIRMEATRDIAKNEEITVDYGEPEDDENEGIACHCGDENCRGRF
ncbi:MAG: hypothetical protein MHM6MM_003682 [Cercozoa sp. M6MM]